MIIRIEISSKRDRQNYHYWSDLVHKLLKNKIVGKENVRIPVMKKERFIQAVIRAWAAVPPLFAAVLVAITCITILVSTVNDICK